MENQKKWAGWLIAGLVAAVGVVAIVMTTGTAEPPAATQPPVVTVSPSASASPEATQPTPSPAASGRTANASAIGYAGPVLVRLTLDDSGAISDIDVGGARFLETVGVGSGVREEAFTSQFIGKTPPLTLNQDIDAVSGATLSSQAAVDAVNEAYTFLKAALTGFDKGFGHTRQVERSAWAYPYTQEVRSCGF